MVVETLQEHSLFFFLTPFQIIQMNDLFIKYYAHDKKNYNSLINCYFSKNNVFLVNISNYLSIITTQISF